MNYMELLKNHGLKATPQRLSVLKILDRREIGRASCRERV